MARFFRRLRRPSLVLLLSLLGLAALKWWQYEASLGLPQRVANTSVRLPKNAPGSGMFEFVDFVPYDAAPAPVDLITTPAFPDDLFILEHAGRIVRFPVDYQGEEGETFLDLRDSTYRNSESGLIGLAFHPQFGQASSPNRGYFYVFYCAKREDGTNSNRLSRFELPDGSRTARRESELILIDQRDDHEWHNAGCLIFGDDGFLYVSLGDEGDNFDYNANAQRIDRDLFSGVLRIDVDMRGEGVSHPIPRQPETGQTANYYIPDDNPFVGERGVLEEFYALGLRNPHRISFDSATGILWAADVGGGDREEINHVVAGGNYQWSYRQGTLPYDRGPSRGAKPSPHYGIDSGPVFEYEHVHGNNCIIGGFVARECRFPELNGYYLFGDAGSGQIWTLIGNVSGAYTQETLAPLPVSGDWILSSICTDQRGNVYALGYQNGIYRLQRREAVSDIEPPQTLSQTGIFSDVSALTPSPGVVPYEINVPSFAYGARKRFWILLPGDGENPDSDCIGFRKRFAWRFPGGTTFVQHFDYPAGGEWFPIETRILVRDEGAGAYGLNYRWDESGTDATLVTESVEETLRLTRPDGLVQEVDWYFPFGRECLQCHNTSANQVLGVNSRQLNRSVDYGHGPKQQLASWFDAGLVRHRENPRSHALRLSFGGYDRLRPDSGQLSLRVHSYFAANCASCHRPLGARADMDLRWQVPLAEAGLVGVPGVSSRAVDGEILVVPGEPEQSLLWRLVDTHEMPPVSRLRRDDEAAELLAEWILSLRP